MPYGCVVGGPEDLNVSNHSTLSDQGPTPPAAPAATPPDAAPVDGAACPFPHGEGAVAHPLGAHPALTGQGAGAHPALTGQRTGTHPALTGQGAGACPVAGVATSFPASAAAAEPTGPSHVATAPPWTPAAEALVREREEIRPD